jgi:hypothetical protein
MGMETRETLQKPKAVKGFYANEILCFANSFYLANDFMKAVYV